MMLRHLFKVGHRLAIIDARASIKYIRYNGQLNRGFSSEMAADWPQQIKDFLEKQKIDKPTLIQEKTLPIVMNNRDLVGIARTGSGKTLAFVIPAIMKILKEREMSGKSADDDGERQATCLILAPTRELATQTSDVLKKFRNLGIRSIVLVGGASRSAQLSDLTYKDHDIYIATPGRLLDLADSGCVDLRNIKYLVLDEADRMLDMGFEPQIRKIVQKIPKDRQTLMWSATWPTEIRDLANDFMQNYEYIAVDSEKLKANPNIEQIVQFCENRDKLGLLVDRLKDLSEENSQARILIFVNTKRMADQLLLQLMRHRMKAICMHGDRSQSQRDHAIRLFKSKQCNIMVATDVAARGLDIDDITHVVNYDFPSSIEDYIHRIGRTARHDKKGTSITFFTSNDANNAKKLEKVLKETKQPIPEELSNMMPDDNYRSAPKSRRPASRRNSFYTDGYRDDSYAVDDDDFMPRGRGSRDYRQDTRSPRSRSSFSFDDYDDNDEGTMSRGRNTRAMFR